MAATERVTILMDRSQKAHLTRRARAAGMSVGEFVRGKALDGDGDDALLELVHESTARANAALDRALVAIQAGRDQDPAREAAARERARREFGGIDFAALATSLGLAPGETEPGQVSRRRQPSP